MPHGQVLGVLHAVVVALGQCLLLCWMCLLHWSRTPVVCLSWQDDANLDLNTFRERFGDVPQKSELTLLCPLKEDPTEKVGVSLLPLWCAAGPTCPHAAGGLCSQ